LRWPWPGAVGTWLDTGSKARNRPTPVAIPFEIRAN
jgi:hypothetical protein